jgi:hypothetical protein
MKTKLAFLITWIWLGALTIFLAYTYETQLFLLEKLTFLYGFVTDIMINNVGVLL